MKKILTAVTATLALTAGSASAWDSYRGMAKEFSHAAVKFNATKIAVVPFTNDNESSLEGKVVADRIGTQLARLGKVELVERDMLQRIMKEQYLMATGALRKDSRGASGLLPVDAIVTGSIFQSDGKVEIHARMIEVKTGRILHAATAEVEPDFPAAVNPPSFQVAVPDIEVQVPQVFHDALADNSCDQAGAQVARLERSIVDAKAIYWAGRMKAPDFSVAKLTSNPGSEIISEQVRAEFYSKMKSWYYRDSTPNLNSSQLDQVAQVESRISEIVRRCNG